VLGSLIYARWARANIQLLLTGGALAIAAGLGVLACAPNLGIALIGAAMAGIANGMLSTAYMTETQDRTPRDWMALVTTLLQSIRQISPGLGILLGGLLAAAGSSRLAFAVGGVGCLLFAGLTFVLMAPKRQGGGGVAVGRQVPSPIPTDPGPPMSGGAPAVPTAADSSDVPALEQISSSEITIAS
jgi:MFS family permease